MVLACRETNACGGRNATPRVITGVALISLAVGIACWVSTGDWFLTLAAAAIPGGVLLVCVCTILFWGVTIIPPVMLIHQLIVKRRERRSREHRTGR